MSFVSNTTSSTSSSSSSNTQSVRAGNSANNRVSVAAGTGFDNLTVHVQSRRDSPQLSERVAADNVISRAIMDSTLTDDLASWLRINGWDGGDIRDLRYNPGETFQSILCEQAVSHRSRPVLNLIPNDIIKEFSDNSFLKIETYDAFDDIIKKANEAELDVQPNNTERVRFLSQARQGLPIGELGQIHYGELGQIPFLSRDEREANRRGYFSDPDGNLNNLFCNEDEESPLYKWLIEDRGWDEEYLHNMRDVLDGKSPKDLVWNIIAVAIEFNDFVVLQSIPREFTEEIKDRLDLTIRMTHLDLDFVERIDVESMDEEKKS